MTSIEQLIREKLTAALLEEKKRIAASLFELMGVPTAPVRPPIAPKPVGATKVAGAQPKPASAPTKPLSGPAAAKHSAALGDRRQKKQGQILTIQQQLSALQSKASTAKDPNAMRDRLNILRQKLTLATSELGQIK